MGYFSKNPPVGIRNCIIPNVLFRAMLHLYWMDWFQWVRFANFDRQPVATVPYAWVKTPWQKINSLDCHLHCNHPQLVKFLNASILSFHFRTFSCNLCRDTIFSCVVPRRQAVRSDNNLRELWKWSQFRLPWNQQSSANWECRRRTKSESLNRKHFNH